MNSGKNDYKAVMWSRTRLPVMVQWRLQDTASKAEMKTNVSLQDF
jgi:hypothetical protein